MILKRSRSKWLIAGAIAGAGFGFDLSARLDLDAVEMGSSAGAWVTNEVDPGAGFQLNLRIT